MGNDKRYQGTEKKVMSIFEIEIRGDIYEIEADDENDAVTKAKIAFPDTTAPPPPKQEPAKEPNVVSKFLGIPQLREDLKKGGKETAELWEQGKPVQSYLHSLGTIGGQVGGAVGYPLLNLGKAMLPKSAEERIAATAKNIFTPTAQSRIPTSTMPGMTGSAPIGAPEARPPAEVFAEKHPDITRGTGDIMNIAGMIPAIKGGTMVAKAGAETAYSTAKGLNKTIGKYAAEKSGVSEEALRMAGKKEGRKTLEKAFGTQAEIGQELVDAIDNAWDVIPKSAEIKTALKAVPKVDPEPILNKIIESLPEATTAEMKAAAVKIQGKGDELLNLADKSGKIPADKLFAFRQEVDNVIGDSFGKESGKYVTALKGIRMSIKDELIKTAKGTEYESTMKDMAKKLDALDKIKTLVGKSGTTRELRSESFIRNINSLGKEKKREWLQNFEEVFGGDFAERAKLGQFAEQMGNEGKGTILPRGTTGKSTLTKGVGLATGSPIITS